MKPTNKKAWGMLKRWIRKEFPVPLACRISVHLVALEGYCGDAILAFDNDEPREFIIRINKHKSFEVRSETLLHEWAHCLTWLGAGQGEVHGPEFGIAHARVYSRFLEWFFGEGGK